MSGDPGVEVTNPTLEGDAELAFEGALRPKSLGEFVGQQKVRGQLQLLLTAASMVSVTKDPSPSSAAGVVVGGPHVDVRHQMAGSLLDRRARRTTTSR